MPVMSEIKEDILETESLKRRPYSVPDGYFTDLQTRLMKIPQENVQMEEAPKVISLWDRLKPYAALAACFVAIVAVGTSVLRKASVSDDDLMYEQLMLADMIPHSDPYFCFMDEEEEPEISPDEIIDYLMETNAEIDYQDLNEN